MIRIPFAFETTEEISPEISSQRLVNMRPEIPTDKSATNIALIGTPGKELKLDFGADPGRGSIQVGDYVYFVARDTFYRMANDFTYVSKGTITNGTGKVRIVSNGQLGSQIVVVDGAKGWCYSITYDTFFELKEYSNGTTTATTAGKLVDSGGAFDTDNTTVGDTAFKTTSGDTGKATITAIDSATTLSVDADIFTSGDDYRIGTDNFPVASDIEFLGGKGIADTAEEGRFQQSATYDLTDWPVLSFDTAEADPDALLRIKAHNSVAWQLGEITTELYAFRGDDLIPINGAVSDIGILAKWSIADFADDTFMFLGRSKNGEVGVYRTSGYEIVKFSDPWMDAQIENLTSPGDATAYSYFIQGHSFYVLNFTAANKSYAVTENGGWFLVESNGGRDIVDDIVIFNRQVLGFDYQTGKLYQIKADVYTDNGVKIKRRVISTHIQRDHEMFSIGEIVAEVESGVGIASGQGSDPLINLEISNDRGHIFGPVRSEPVGKMGQYAAGAKFTRNGSAKGYVLNFSMDDPVKWVITGVFIRGD